MQPNILVIDDDPAMRHILETILQRRDYNVISASSIEDTLRLLQNSTPDVICCDLMMPDVTGIDFLEMRHDMPHIADIPVIVITAAGDPQMISKAIELGAFSHLPKPMSSVQLLEMVEAALTGV